MTHDIYRLLFLQGNDAAFIIDAESRRFIEVNEAFVELTGYTPADIEAIGLTARDLIHAEDLPVFDAKSQSRLNVGRERYVIRLRTHAGETRSVEVSVALLGDEGETRIAGTIRDVTAQRRLEKTLNSEISRQRNMTYKAAQASVRIGQVLEKLRSVPALAHELLAAQTSDDLLRAVVLGLTDGDRFNYARVAIYLRDPDAPTTHLVHAADSNLLQPAADDPFRERHELILPRDRVPIASLPAVAAALESGELTVDGLVHVIPMLNRREVVGALLIEFLEFEKNLFDENATIRRAQEDTIKTIGNLVALGLENLQLAGELQRQALADQLTGLHNRRYFDQVLAEFIDSAGRENLGAHTLVLLDVDNFKDINDTLGHHQGDRVLRRVGVLLAEHFRGARAISRVGGDEFAVIMPGRQAEVAERAERLRSSVAEGTSSGATGFVTVSVGVAGFEPALTGSAWLIEADRALYAAKLKGRNCVVTAHAVHPASPGLESSR